jgi:molybdopterin-guanine dinucleotide biosynthesis protein A
VLVAGLLLTGGASRRLGTPKAAAQRAGERLADRSARVLGAVATPVLEVGPGWSALDAVCEEPAGSGPLAALAAGGAALAARGLGDRATLVLAVDLPFVDPPVLRTLADAPDADAVVPRVDGRAQPLCARYSPVALAAASTLVATGARAMHALLEVVDVRWLDDADWGTATTARTFFDVDTPADAREAGLEGHG